MGRPATTSTPDSRRVGARHPTRSRHPSPTFCPSPNNPPAVCLTARTKGPTLVINQRAAAQYSQLSHSLQTVRDVRSVHREGRSDSSAGTGWSSSQAVRHTLEPATDPAARRLGTWSRGVGARGGCVPTGFAYPSHDLDMATHFGFHVSAFVQCRYDHSAEKGWIGRPGRTCRRILHR